MVKGWAFPDRDEFMAKELGNDGTYQLANLMAALRYVTDHSLAIDGGAHVGTWSAVMSAQFDRVIAVEPCADTFEALEANLATFGCANVQAKRLALGSRAHEVAMVLDGRGAEMKNTGATRVTPLAGARGERVSAEAIDTWELPSLGFLKLDIEGSEVDALFGAEATITRCRPIILFENKGLWTRLGGYHRLAPQGFLSMLGYRQLDQVSCDIIWGPQ